MKMTTTIMAFLQWLESTSGSTIIRKSQSIFMYPTIESVHVLSLCLFLGLAIMLDLRLLGLTMRRTTVSEVVQRFQPWTLAGFVIQVISGALLFYSNPVRFYENPYFRIKIGLLLLAGLNAWVFHTVAYRNVAAWDRDLVPPTGARVAGAVSLALWTCIVAAGRLIAFSFN
jgi:hypothetical protein